jgi:hypothetical protein
VPVWRCQWSAPQAPSNVTVGPRRVQPLHSTAVPLALSEATAGPAGGPGGADIRVASGPPLQWQPESGGSGRTGPGRSGPAGSGPPLRRAAAESGADSGSECQCQWPPPWRMPAGPVTVPPGGPSESDSVSVDHCHWHCSAALRLGVRVAAGGPGQAAGSGCSLTGRLSPSHCPASAPTLSSTFTSVLGLSFCLQVSILIELDARS